jgi:hypothetical protein
MRAAPAGVQPLIAVRQGADLARGRPLLGSARGLLNATDSVGKLRAHTLDRFEQILEVDFSDNIDIDAQVVNNEAVIAVYHSRGS